MPEDPPETVDRVDLERYTGLWYEIARLPVFFQDEADLAAARYSLNESGSLELVNTALQPDGTAESVTGSAKPVPGSGNAKLRVTIDNFFAELFGSPPEHGNYWILKLADDYAVALVGSPDRDNLWLLARSPDIPSDTLRRYLRAAEAKGFATDAMIVNNGAFPPGWKPPSPAN